MGAALITTICGAVALLVPISSARMGSRVRRGCAGRLRRVSEAYTLRPRSVVGTGSKKRNGTAALDTLGGRYIFSRGNVGGGGARSNSAN
jgi:hypothetical protein